MEYCTIFSETENLKEIYNIIKNYSVRDRLLINGEDDNWSQIILLRKNLLKTHSITFKSNLKKTNDGFDSILEGVFNYFYQVRTDNPQAKKSILKLIKNFSFALAIGTTSLEKFSDLLKNIQKTNEGILFMGKEAFINKNGQIIFDCNGYSDLFHLNESERKKQLNENSPVSDLTLHDITGDDSAKLKSIRQIVGRVAAITITVLKGEGVTDGNLTELMAKFSLDESVFSAKERDFFRQKNAEEFEKIKFVWKSEALLVLLWVLGFVKELGPPDKVCDIQELTSYLLNFHDMNEFTRNVRLRSISEILEQAYLACHYNQSCIEARNSGIEIPQEINNAVVYERSYAFNWLLSSAARDWDAVNT